MSRRSPRQDEIFARKHLELYLNGVGVGFSVDESYTDCPDLVIVSEGKRIGCEFATVTVEQLMKWAEHKQFGALKHRRKYVVVIPIEPHMWIEKILSDKGLLLPKYVEHANLDECWLLLHCGSNRRKWFIPFDEGMLEVFRAYAVGMRSGFSKVLFLNQDKQIFELKSDSSTIHPNAELVARKVQVGWPAQVLELVRVNIFGKETINHAELPIEEKIFIPYLEPGVIHGDPEARARQNPGRSG